MTINNNTLTSHFSSLSSFCILIRNSLWTTKNLVWGISKCSFLLFRKILVNWTSKCLIPKSWVLPFPLLCLQCPKTKNVIFKKYITKKFFFYYYSGFCHTLKWISHGFTCVPHPNPPSHLPLHLIPLDFPSTPGPSACLMHPTWAGDLFHPR